VRALLAAHLPNVAVMGYNEVTPGVEVESMGLVQVDTGAEVHTSDATHMQGALN